MNKTIATIITLGLAAFTAQSALATQVKAREHHRHEHHAQLKHRDPGINRHQLRQNERIKQGVRSGELTRGETRQLAQEQRAIRQKERQYKSDGVLTRNERQDLRQDQKAASRDIYEQKHDAQTR